MYHLLKQHRIHLDIRGRRLGVAQDLVPVRVDVENIKY